MTTRSTYASDLVDLTVALHHATDKAVLVSETGEESKAKWLPKSKVEIEETGKRLQGVNRRGQIQDFPVVTVTLPEWLALDKGLA